jgi:hypothetical protein
MDFTGYRKIASTCPISIGMLDPNPPNVKVDGGDDLAAAR